MRTRHFICTSSFSYRLHLFPRCFPAEVAIMKAMHSRVISEPPTFVRSQVERAAGAPSWVDALESVATRLLPSLAAIPFNGSMESKKADTSLVLQELRRGEVRRFDHADGVEEIRVLSGVIWLTATPADGDILLRPLDSHRFSSGWPIVIEALEEASIVSTRRRD
jgi:hypothetical protein